MTTREIIACAPPLESRSGRVGRGCIVPAKLSILRSFEKELIDNIIGAQKHQAQKVDFLIENEIHAAAQVLLRNSFLRGSSSKPFARAGEGEVVCRKLSLLRIWNVWRALRHVGTRPELSVRIFQCSRLWGSTIQCAAQAL